MIRLLITLTCTDYLQIDMYLGSFERLPLWRGVILGLRLLVVWVQVC
jgi:hypothetical protein